MHDIKMFQVSMTTSSSVKNLPISLKLTFTRIYGESAS